MHPGFGWKEEMGHLKTNNNNKRNKKSKHPESSVED